MDFDSPKHHDVIQQLMDVGHVAQKTIGSIPNPQSNVISLVNDVECRHKYDIQPWFLWGPLFHAETLHFTLRFYSSVIVIPPGFLLTSQIYFPQKLIHLGLRLPYSILARRGEKCDPINPTGVGDTYSYRSSPIVRSHAFLIPYFWSQNMTECYATVFYSAHREGAPTSGTRGCPQSLKERLWEPNWPAFCTDEPRAMSGWSRLPIKKPSRAAIP